MEGRTFIVLGIAWMAIALAIWLMRLALDVPWLAPAFAALGAAFLLAGFRWTVEERRPRD